MFRNLFGIKYAVMAGMIVFGFAHAAQAMAGGAPQLPGNEAKEGDLIVHATGFNTGKGHAIADLFVEGEDILGKPHIRIVGDIKGGQATLAFPRMKEGGYAVRVFHDENGNNALDHNFLNFPSEPLGFSNGFSLGLFSGFPTFAKLRFEFNVGARPLEIVVH